MLVLVEPGALELEMFWSAVGLPLARMKISDDWMFIYLSMLI